ncbi:MAG: transposase [Planctomycetaceae bacterium]|nr:transposase [Planctomycetaceae bacterium]
MSDRSNPRSELTMDFPITELMDEDACYAKLVEWLHPDGLACPRCHEADRMMAHRRHRAPILDFRCGHCGRVFNAFTGTILHGLRRRPSPPVRIVRGIAQGVPTAQLARELDCDRSGLLERRHRLPDAADRNRDRMPRDDEVLEADEMDQNAGEKRRAAPRPRRPTAASCQPATRPWQLGQGSPAGLRGGRTRERAGPPDGRRASRQREVAEGGAACDVADGDGSYR